MAPPYRQLCLDERETIYRMNEAGMSVSAIAERLDRHRSTIYRELRRNYFYDEDAWFRGYFPNVAHRIARERRAPGRKLLRHPLLAAYVIEGLQRCWSPEQIAGRLRLEAPFSQRVSHETIYRYVYSAEGKRQDLYRHLPWARRCRRPRRARKPRGLQIPAANGIKQRPAEIANRQDFGHWEGDLMAFRQIYGKANLACLVERKSRFAIVWCNPNRGSAGIMAGICQHLAPFPDVLRQSVTFDRGTEFAGFRALHSELKMCSYFCDPKAPWQKGGVENFNGRLRRFLPSDTDIAAMEVPQIEAICHQLNSTPRKCLGYRTPGEVLMQQVNLPIQPNDQPEAGLAPPPAEC
ncbi:IS30 family transposase [Novosphingobium sp. KN65.2]|uniref:IS30 family transposase n=1 Tax=Novosphingobium sp. KN65.2 TaxID=1478134 RepID=UPI0005DFA53D|nr:IS30 family transposase [Novosphingobium sp. KN65.2]CDO38561.1 transposase [Novosphingobium sp. KN65.2]